MLKQKSRKLPLEAPPLAGGGDVTISGKPLQVKEGELLVMPANQPHALRVVKKFEMILTMIRS
jgi:quercetin dioxygenase-like cupin family protein